MADIQSKILNKYGIDIAAENIFKLYKVDSEEISSQDLEAKIQETRKRWNTSINGANEKNAERDRARLEKADKYEAILRNDKLRNEVFEYYKASGGSAGGSDGANPEAVGFAREYFGLVATTKKIRKADVDFFFKYYQSERKNKKAILEMLNKEFKVNVLGKEDSYADEENDPADEKGRKKRGPGPLIVNLFQETTVLKLRRAIEKYEEAAASDELCQRYPKLCEGLYEYLEIKDVENAQQFVDLMSSRGKEVYAVRQERGTEYVPLVDLFNILQGVGDYQDVADNIPEFKLLLKYPNLTPYMYSFVEMRPSTLKGIINVANKDYAFRDDTDFILNYYKPIHDNFGISDTGISGAIRKAEKKAKQNKILNDIDGKLGRKKKRKISIGAELVHWLVYWPIFMVYFVFEVAKIIFTKLRRFTIPIFLLVFGLSNYYFPSLIKMDNLLVLRKIFHKAEWLTYLDGFWGENMANGFEVLLLSLMLIIILLVIYIPPALFVSLFAAGFADDFNKRFDWVGIERTFRQILTDLRKKTENQYIAHKETFVKSKIPKIIINFVSLAILMAMIYFAPAGFRALGKMIGF